MAIEETEPPRTRKRRFAEEEVIGFVERYLLESNDLTVKAWDRWAKQSGAPLNSGVARHLGGGTFSEAITRYGREYGQPAKAYLWTICPEGRRHQSHEYFFGTPVAHVAGACTTCARNTAAQAAWVAAQPTFGELYPHLIPFLADPQDAESRAAMVGFCCFRCGHTPIRWSPRWEGLPVCGHCRVSAGLPAGALIKRRGGGVAVRLESEVAAELVLAGVPATALFGIVLPPNRYFVGIAKPDVLLVGEAIAVEIDNHPGDANRHHMAEGQRDDRQRDELLNSCGWRVLRIRRPDAPISGDWPWRVESTSQTARVLAREIIATTGCDTSVRVDQSSP